MQSDKPLTPEEEARHRSEVNTDWGANHRVWATLDAARERIAELEGTAQEVQSFATNYMRERDEARAEVERMTATLREMVEAHKGRGGQFAGAYRWWQVAESALSGNAPWASIEQEKRDQEWMSAQLLRVEVARMTARYKSDEWIYLEQRAQKAEAEVRSMRPVVELCDRWLSFGVPPDGHEEWKLWAERVRAYRALSERGAEGEP